MEQKDTKTCTYCGEEILAVAKKCRYCGEWLTEEAKPAPKLVPCPICGEDIEEGTEKCPHCGENTSNTSSVHSVEDKEPVSLPSSSTTVPPGESCMFKDFLVGKSLTAGLFILLAVRLLVGLLNLAESPAIEIVATICDAMVGIAMSLLIIQRFAADRSKIDITSFIAIASCVLWPIAVYMGRDGYNNAGLDILEYARVDDTSENIINLRYFFACGMACFAISTLLEIASKILMWMTAKPQFKATSVVGIIASISAFLFVISTKSMSQGLFITCLMVVGVLYTIYYIMILANGAGSPDDKQMDQQTSAKNSNTSVIWIIVVVVAIIIGAILLFANKSSNNTSVPSSNETEGSYNQQIQPSYEQNSNSTSGSSEEYYPGEEYAGDDGSEGNYIEEEEGPMPKADGYEDNF